MEIQKKVKRVRFNALVRPETMEWLDLQCCEHEASLGELVDSLVTQERSKEEERAR